MLSVDHQQSLALAPFLVKGNALFSVASIPALLIILPINHASYNGYNELFAVS